MKENLIIRPLRPEDRDGIEVYFDRLRGEAGVFFNPGDYNRLRFRSVFDGKIKNFTCFVAEDPDNGMIAGMVFLAGTQYLVPMLGLGIDDAYSGCGLGGRLLNYAHDYAKEQGMGGIILNVHFANTHAQALYAKMGYEQFGISQQGQFLYIKRFLRETE